MLLDPQATGPDRSERTGEERGTSAGNGPAICSDPRQERSRMNDPFRAGHDPMEGQNHRRILKRILAGVGLLILLLGCAFAMVAIVFSLWVLTY
jgi:hypothetical protein